MIFLFKKTKLFLLFASLLWAVAVVVGRLTVFDEYGSTLSGILSPILAFLCGVYIIYAFAARQARRLHRAYTEILSQECDAERFVSLYEPVREAGRSNRRAVYLTESSYATGLHLVGRSEEAREIVRALVLRPDFGRQRAVDRADAYIDIGIYSVALRDLVSAREAITAAEEILEAMQVGTQEYSRIYREVTRLRHRADVADGRCEEALEYFTDTSREYTVPYTKVNRMHTLSEIYRATGDVEQLRKCLSYVAERGGTLAIAKKAREELRGMPEE